MSVAKPAFRPLLPACTVFAVWLFTASAAYAQPTISGISIQPSSPVPDGANVVVTIHGQGAPPADQACGAKVTIGGLPHQMIPVQGFPVTFQWQAKIPKPPFQDEKPSTHSVTIVASGAALGVWGACKGSESVQVTVGDPWKTLKKLEGPAPKFDPPGPKPTVRDESQRELDPEKTPAERSGP